MYCHQLKFCDKVTCNKFKLKLDAEHGLRLTTGGLQGLGERAPGFPGGGDGGKADNTCQNTDLLSQIYVII